jgi:hypothetical protein
MIKMTTFVIIIIENCQLNLINPKKKKLKKKIKRKKKKKKKKKI